MRLLTESLNALPAENLAVFEAAILIASPVFGLRPGRADLLRNWKLPNPEIFTSTPVSSDLPILSKNVNQELISKYFQFVEDTIEKLVNSVGDEEVEEQIIEDYNYCYSELEIFEYLQPNYIGVNNNERELMSYFSGKRALDERKRQKRRY